MVHKTARSRHHDLGLLLQLLNLTSDAGSAVENRHPDALIVGQQAAQLIPDLQSQLPGGCQDQCLYLGAVGLNVLNHGDAERKSLAGAGGSLGNDILPLHKVGDGLGLDGGGIAVSLLFQSLQHRFAESQIFKTNGSVCHRFLPLYAFITAYIVAVLSPFCNTKTFYFPAALSPGISRSGFPLILQEFVPSDPCFFRLHSV